MTTGVSFQSHAKTGLPFDGDVGNLLQQNQTSAEQPEPPRLLGEPTSLLKQETFSFSRKTVRSETHACQMEERMYKLGLIGLFSSLL